MRSRKPWLATLYLASYLPFGTLVFGFVLAVLVVCYAMNITWLGLPMLIGASTIVRGCAHLERHRARLVTTRIEPDYRPATSSGVFAQVRTRWRDLATWRDCAYLVLLFPPLLALDLITLTTWLSLLAGVTLPLWFWSVPGIWVPNLLVALLVALGSAVLVPFAARVVVAVAALHATVARSLLGPRVDPLADVKRMLAEPGPLAA